MNVVSLSPIWRDELAAQLRAGVSLVTVDGSDDAELYASLPSAHVLLTTQFDRRMASACRALELLLCPAAGTEGIDKEAVPRGVPIVSGIGHETAMAEYVIGALVALRRRFLAADASMRQGVWRFGYFGDRELVEELFASKLGIIGFGRIGVEVARRAAAFGMSCRAVTLHPGKPVEPGLLSERLGDLSVAADVDALVGWCDALVVACALSPTTRGLLDARRLNLMSASAVLVNVARGPVVEEGALYDALRRRAIAGAALDVWYRYPDPGSNKAEPSEFPFGELDNVLLTPHASGWTAGAKRRKLEFLARTINAWYEQRK